MSKNTNPKGQGVVYCVFLKLYRPLGVLLYLGAIATVLIIISNQFSANTCISESATPSEFVNRQYGSEYDVVGYSENLNEITDATPGGPSVRFENLRSSGWKTYFQNFSVNHPFEKSGDKVRGTNVFAISRAPRASGTEAVVVSVPYRRGQNKTGLGSTSHGTALLHILANNFINRTYCSKDIIFLVVEEENVGTQAWLEAYHNVYSYYIDRGPLHRRRGAIVAALNLHLPDKGLDHLDLYIKGLISQLPKWDLFNIVMKLCHMNGAQPTFRGEWCLLSDQVQENSGVRNMPKAILSGMLRQASGKPYGVHGLFLRYGIPAITLHGKSNGSNQMNEAYSDDYSIGSILKNIHNLLEGSHQFLFVSKISLYIPMGMLLIIPTFHALALWYLSELKCSKFDLPNLKFRQYHYVITYLIDVHLFGVLLHLSPGFFVSCFSLCNINASGMVAQVSSASVFTLITILQAYISKRHLEEFPYNPENKWMHLKCFALVWQAISLFVIFKINFSLAFLVAIITIPVFAFCRPYNNVIVSSLNRLMLLLVSPPSLLVLIITVHDIFIKGNPISLDTIANVISVASRAIPSAVHDQYLFNDWTFVVVTLLLYPSWQLFWISSSVKRGCWACPLVGKTSPTSCKELINASTLKENMKNLKNILSTAVEFGVYEDKEVDELNEKFMQCQYPNAKSECYTEPTVFEYRYPGQSSHVVFNMDGNSEVSVNGNKRIKFACLKRNRRGEDPEEEVFNMFCEMLLRKKVPSFVIQGYKWNTNDDRQKLDTIFKMLRVGENGWKKTDRESDLLISLPGKCLISIEVKGANWKDGGVKGVTPKAFEQGEHALTHISIVNYDLFYEKNIPFIKVAALPNCSRDDLRGQVCDNCSINFITKDELINIGEVYKWFLAVTKDLQTNQMSLDFNGDLHEKIIGRLLGPKYLVEEAAEIKSFRPVGKIDGKTYGLIELTQTVRTADQITNKYGTIEHILTRLSQFNEEQCKLVEGDHKLLYITGEPGSGKTLLLWLKIEVLLKEGGGKNSKVIMVPGNKSDFLYRKCTQQFSQYSRDGRLKIIRYSKDEKWYNMHTWNVLPKIIDNIQQTYKEGVLNIFIDEATFLLKDTDWSMFKDDWNQLDLDRLGYLWVIQNPLSTLDEEAQAHRFMKCLSSVMRMIKETFQFALVHILDIFRLGQVNQNPLSTTDDSGVQEPDDLGGSSPGFKKIHLKYVMRMTKENVRFVSYVLRRPALISGLGVAGYKPVFYSMACLCASSKGFFHCKRCVNKRVFFILARIFKDLSVSWNRTSEDEVCIRDFTFLMDEKYNSWLKGQLKKYIIKASNGQYDANTVDEDITVTDSLSFRGCEAKIVVVDLSDPAYDIKTLMEAFTRCLSRLIIIDTGIDYKECSKEDYKYVKGRIIEANGEGLVRLTEVTNDDLV